MKELWNEKYSGVKYYYGKAPNEYFKKELDKLAPGKILLLSEGEGRNAVYAALHNWETSAVDFSEKGKLKTFILSEEFNVTLDYFVMPVEEFSFPENEYDAVALIFAHYGPEIRSIIHKRVLNSLKPGGEVIMEVFGKSQINNNSGGPDSLEMLYTVDELIKDFEGMKIKEALEIRIELDEGERHRGTADVVRFRAVKV